MVLLNSTKLLFSLISSRSSGLDGGSILRLLTAIFMILEKIRERRIPIIEVNIASFNPSKRILILSFICSGEVSKYKRP